MLIAWLGNVSVASAEKVDRPNVLVLIVDDLGWADLGIQGAADVVTPQIDSIGKQGVRLTNAYVSAPVCSPSRAGLLTGRFQTRFGHELNHPQADRGPVGLPVEEQLWPVYFRQAGYVTGHAGKWHLGNAQMPEFTPNARGFTESYHFGGQKKLPEPKLAYKYNNQSATSDESYVDLGIAESSARFIKAHQSEPWFLYSAFLTPHEPTDLPPGVEDKFASITDPKRRKFVAAMSLVDSAVGRILRVLEDTQQAERTLVIFLSDNGSYPGNGSRNTPFRGTKSTLWEGGIRSPFLIRWPGHIPAGTTLETPVISLDLLPTALAAAQIAQPAGDRRLDGKNLLPLLTGQSVEVPHEFLYWRYGDQWAIRHEKWKLVVAGKANELGPPRLYDLQADVEETKDVSGQHPEVVNQLRAAWEQWNRQNVAALWGK